MNNKNSYGLEENTRLAGNSSGATSVGNNSLSATSVGNNSSGSTSVGNNSSGATSVGNNSSKVSAASAENTSSEENATSSYTERQQHRADDYDKAVQEGRTEDADLIRCEIRRDREKIVEDLSRKEDRLDDDDPKTEELRDQLINADSRLRESKLDAIIDDMEFPDSLDSALVVNDFDITEGE